MKKTTLILTFFIAFALTFSSCASTAPSKGVTRVAADTQIDLSGRWNDTDSQMVAQAMIDDVTHRPWIADFRDANNNKKPVVIVGSIRNRSSEHIDSTIFSKNIERELINSGKVSFVADSKQRDELRAEKKDQQLESSSDTAKRLGQETGADFMLQGTISSQTDAVSGQRVVFYQVDLELINLENNEKAWIGSKQIKKVIDQASSKF